jgi:3-phenylpropionate/cinnamic acid dioxygenase small subunit
MPDDRPANLPDTTLLLREVSDRFAIEDLLNRYCRAIDTRDWELLDTVFTADAFIDYTTSGGVKGRYPEVRAWLAETLAGFPMSQHLVTNREVKIDGDRAESRAYFYNPMGLARPEGGMSLFFVGGYYEDKLARTETGWRIRERFERQAWVQRNP